METVSQRLADTTEKLDKVLDQANIDIAVQRERIDNHEETINNIQAAIKEHQSDDRAAHKEMNDKLDSIKSSVDVLSGAAIKVEKPTESLPSKIGDIIDRWKYWFYGGIFVAGVLTHKANFFDFLEKIFTGHS